MNVLKMAKKVASIFIPLIAVPMIASAGVVDPGNERQIWRDAAVISHLYTENVDTKTQVMVLSANEQHDVAFEILPRQIAVGQQPHKVLWELELIPQTKFFKLKSLQYGLYLAGNQASGRVSLVSDTEAEGLHTHWYIKALTTEGDVAILNRNEHDNGKEWALIPQRGSNPQARPLELVELNDPNNSKFLLRMDSRFLETWLTPFDIERETCLVYLNNGAPMDGFYTPAPSATSSDGVSRRFKVKLGGDKAHLYEFVDDLGFDPRAQNLTDEQQAVLAQIRNTIANMRVVQNGEYTADAVYNTFINQLSLAYGSESAAMLYFPGSWDAFRADRAAGKIVKQVKVLNGKSLGIRVTIHDPLVATYSYAMLALKTKNGIQQFVFVDPTDVTRPAKPY
ncbi:hypothetical protein [Marinibactrum halimedae]|uniref:Uncharacterized protein n=1 Tax=Marinibactrum halimedae TaxID=1444977 RepID=A0AA37T4W2_9GAMM|nr:hypothetical protein [Marinibactrum halimedae]MCD9458731.1 hypothetical protein [Marinibactrum halimedae]GLS25288.1 hypothetical protein GCM10007877_10020 [Marinibactrum halimedae]